MRKPLVSIITTVFNSGQYIESAIQSVLNQTYPNIEYIVIDAGSTDGTLKVIGKYKDKIAKFISEKDEGIYDGMNKGLKMATGEIIGIINADDFLADNKAIESVVDSLEKSGADVCWGDLVYVRKGNPEKIVRFWKSSEYKPGSFKKGWMPPHPTFYARRKIYEKYGFFDLRFKIAADYELMLRFLERYRIKSCYLPRVLVKMRIGGESNKSLWGISRANFESLRAWRVNNLEINPLRVLLKPLSKITQFFRKP